MRSTSLLLLFLFGCPDPKPGDTDDTDVASPVDADGDGAAADLDCDDADATRHPGAEERCDGIDQDCDGRVDDDAPDAETWYADADGDGHGDPAASTVACDAPAGAVARGDDCDDTDAAVLPGRAELCNGVDDDCDGHIDPADAVGAPTWYADSDGDGYGNPTVGAAACTQPAGAAADATDCDDSDPTAHPGGTEVCGGRDEDCDGTTDELDAVGTVPWYADADGDGFGDPADTLDACAAPAGYGADATDCDDADPDVNPDGIELCDGIDDDCDTTIDEDDAVDAGTWFGDGDLDGYGGVGTAYVSCAAPGGYLADSSDCDDAVATIHPGAAETCDGIDQDCDGTADDGATDATTWFADTDADGFGDAASTTAACDRPAGYVADATDCDDAAASAHPGGAEVCDAADVDEDCDGLADDADADVDSGTRSTWYVDADGDGWGTDATDACDLPAGAAAVAGDCTDTDATIHPGAAEACDGLDQDCDGAVDDGAPAINTFYLDADGDGWGDSARTTLSCATPAGYVADGGDCDDADVATSPGADEICWDGVDNDCDGLDSTDTDCAPSGTIVVTAADVRLTGGASGDLFGVAMSATGDVNGDGIDDLLVGASGRDTTDAGAAYLWYGPIDASSLTYASADADFSGVAGDALGVAVAMVDVDGDGVDDIVVGASGADGGGSGAGAVYVWRGSATERAGTASVSLADIELRGEGAGDAAGAAIARVGDADGDGLDDLLVGAAGADAGGTGAGAAYLVLSGVATGVTSLADADTVFLGEREGEAAGTAVAGAGDVDADGLADLLIGAPYADGVATDAGQAYLVYAPFRAGIYDLGKVQTRIQGTDGRDYAGTYVAAAGDVDADGYADVLVGAPGDDDAGTDAGKVVLFYGPVPPARLDLGDADAWFTGEAAGDGAGPVGSGDIDADGWSDVIVGAPSADPGGTSSGAAYLFYGPLAGSGAISLRSADLEVDGDGAGEALGGRVAGGTVDVDAFGDILVAADSATVGSVASVGEVRVILGGSREADSITAPVPDPADDADGDGWTELTGDCDDTRAAEAPDLAEACASGLDEDCDGFDAPCLRTGTFDLSSPDLRIYASTTTDDAGRSVGRGDFDGDGYLDLVVGAWGNDAAGTNAGAVYVFLGPLPREGSLLTSAADLTLTGEYASDYAGYAVSGAGDVNGDGFDDLVVGAYGYRGGTGKAYVVYGSADPRGTRSLSTADVQITGVLTGDGTAYAVAGGGDLDGDGYDDIAIGAYTDDYPGMTAGAVYVFRGGSTLATGLITTADTVLLGEQYNDQAGYSLAFAGDVNADGYDDLLVGAPSADEVASAAGKAYLFYGPLDDGAVDLYFADATFLGETTNDLFGKSVAGAGDVNGDGYDDVIVGVDYDDGAATDAGAGAVWYGPVPRARHYLSDADALLLGEVASDHAGRTVAGAGDVNGDGYADVLVGAPDHDQGGAASGSAYLVFGPLASGTSLGLSAADAEYFGDASDAASTGVVGGDFDGDGFSDVIVGSEVVSEVTFVRGGWSTDTGTHTVTAVDLAADTDGDGYTPAAGDCDDTDSAVSPGGTEVCEDGVDEDCDGTDRWCAPASQVNIDDRDMPRFYGAASDSRTGGALAGIGDIDDDGYDDVLIGASGFDVSTDDGQAYLLHGPISNGYDMLAYADAKFTGTANRDDFGEDVAAVGDVDGDGLPDLAVVASGSDLGGAASGAVYIWTAAGAPTGSLAAADADVIIVGGYTDYLYRISDAGDVNGDGIADMWMGASAYDGGGSQRGAAMLVYGPLTMGDSLTTSTDADVVIEGEVDNDNLAQVAAAGDVDGDGTQDVMVAAPYYDGPYSNSGVVYFYYGGTITSGSAADADATFYGEDTDVLSVGGRAGDLDDDGYDDFLLTTYYYGSNTGAAYVMLGAPAAGAQSAGVASTRILGSYVESNSYDTVGVGDLDADGYDDLVTGTPFNDRGGSNGGCAMIFYGPVATGDVGLEDADAFLVGSGSAGVGASVAPAGDTNADGYDDFLLSYYDLTGIGGGWVIFGGER
jgi:hypothetical protein